MPTFRHEEQPGADLRSRRTREKQDEPGIVACIYNLQSSYEACEKTILASRRLAKGEGGRDLLSIIGRRISWLQDDVISNRRKFDDRSVDLLNCGTQREQVNVTFEKKVRSIDTRLRQTRSDFIRPVADRRNCLDDRLPHSIVTYEEKIQARLREAYKTFRKVVDEYDRDVDEAIEAAKKKEKARKRKRR